jgi:hypothetical protein
MDSNPFYLLQTGANFDKKRFKEDMGLFQHNKTTDNKKEVLEIEKALNFFDCESLSIDHKELQQTNEIEDENHGEMKETEDEQNPDSTSFVNDVGY